ncbi:acyl-CoA thioesterase [Chloroherpeton thalassium]|nr:thioesterase family protein [Chloroherpeton thalassium]
MEQKVFSHTLRVKYADTDKMQFVYYGRYFEYFEAARNEMLREIGFEYKLLETLGVMLPVVAAHADYFSPAYYDDLLLIESRIQKLENVRLSISYELFEKGARKKLVQGYTTHAFINQNGRPTRPPKELLQKLESAR